MRIFSIILADDEQQILYGMKKGIEWEKLGFRVAGVAQNGKEALELMEEVRSGIGRSVILRCHLWMDWNWQSISMRII